MDCVDSNGGGVGDDCCCCAFFFRDDYCHLTFCWPIDRVRPPQPLPRPVDGRPPLVLAKYLVVEWFAAIVEHYLSGSGD